MWDTFCYYVQNESTGAQTAYDDNEVPDFARVLRKETGRNFACRSETVGMDGWINVGKRERRVELDGGGFLLRADGKLDKTASTNNGVQHETT